MNETGVKRLIVLLLLLFAHQNQANDYSDAAIACYQAFASEQYALAFGHCSTAASQGDDESQFKLATLYARGLGVSNDAAESVYWLRQAADQKHGEAEYNLGSAFQNGNGVEIDLEAAAHWFRRAASQGNLKAQRNLAEMYASGMGVGMDLHKAYLWHLKAAESGMSGSQLRVGLMVLQGQGVEPDREEALLWINKAARRGNADAQFALGVLLIDEAETTAIDWYKQAAAQGQVNAMFNLATHLSLPPAPTESQLEEAYRLSDKAVKAGHADSLALNRKIAEQLALVVAGQTPHPSAATDPYTIQLVMSSSSAGVESFIDQYSLRGQARRYEILREGERAHVVALGEYVDHAAASRALAALPATLKALKPFVRRLAEFD